MGSKRRSTDLARSVPRPTIGYDAYWRFAHERHEIYLRRLRGEPGSLTNDPVISAYRFTNAFRAADRVSQFLITSVQYDRNWDWQDTFVRTLVFKLFNRIDTWRHLVDTIGQPDTESLVGGDVEYALGIVAERQPIYSAAYIMPPPRSYEGPKYKRHLHLLRQMLADSTHERIRDARSMAEAFDLLRSIESIGNFLAYQFIIDLSYSRHLPFREDEFVVAGPGALRGLRKCFDDTYGYSAPDLIRWTAERQSTEFSSRGLEWCGLWGRELQLVDIQNLFCEIDKYTRVALPELSTRAPGNRIKQRYHANMEPMQPWFPPKWGINHNLTYASRQVGHDADRWAPAGYVSGNAQLEFAL